MKKILLITIAAFIYYSGNSQILSASSSADFQTWSVFDADGDTFIFGIFDLSTSTVPAFAALGAAAGSRSYDPNANPTGLTPDNYFISPKMNITSFSSIDVSYKVFSIDNSTYFEENYTAYITDDVGDAASYVTLTSEVLTAGEQVFTRSFTNLTNFASSDSLFLIFRHHNCFDENIILFDDILVEGSGSPCNLIASSTSTDATSGSSDGTATATASGGTAPYTYSWSPSGGNNATATNLSAGNYTCTITDADNCSATTSTTVGTATCSFTSSVSSTDETALNANDGTATATPTSGTGPYTYSWSPSGGNNATAVNLAPGTYTCSIMDANSCTSSVTATINEYVGCDHTAISNVVHISGPAANDGEINLNVSNGQAPYIYSWSPNVSTSASANNLIPGSYVIDITDASGCTITVTEYVEDFVCTLGASTSSSDVSAVGASDGTASVTATQGTSPYTYSWSPGGLTGVFQNGLSKGTYNVTITDANNCSVAVTIIINDPGCSGLTVTSTSTNESFIGSNDGSATVTASGGTSPYTYVWSPAGGNSATATNLAPDVYTAIVIDDAGCSETSVVTIGSGQPVSIEEESISLLLNAYPNPANNSLNIESNEVISEVLILNLNGQNLYSQTLEAKNLAIDVSNLSNGVYFYQVITTNGKTSVNRFIKN